LEHLSLPWLLFVWLISIPTKSHLQALPKKPPSSKEKKFTTSHWTSDDQPGKEEAKKIICMHNMKTRDKYDM
jgi:hypothetical protein